MNIRVAAVDDNPSDSEYIDGLVKQWAAKNAHTVSISAFPSAEAFLFEREDERAFDILLLDIEMHGMNGVELAKKIRETDEAVQLVFITGFPDFIAEGYDVSALH